MLASEDPFAVARPPDDFKLYETRDGRFSERLAPCFVKGRGRDPATGFRVLDRHTDRNGVAHGGAWADGRADALKAGRRNLFVRAELAVDGVLAFTAEGVWKRIQLRPQRAPERNP